MLLFFFFFYSSEEPSQMHIVYKNCSGREDKAAHVGESSIDSHVNAVMLVDRYLDGKRKR